MQNKANLYANTQVNEGGVKGLTTPCAKVCRIVGVEDAPNLEMLKVRFDISEGTDTGLFLKCTREKNTGKYWYQGELGVSYKDDYMSSFKGSITAIEESNPGYRWNWDEKTLMNRTVVVVFGEVEAVLDDGKVVTLIKPRFFRSVQAFREGRIELPKKKLAKQPTPKPNADYAGYQQSQYNQPTTPAYNYDGSAVDDKDLPW